MRKFEFLIRDSRIRTPLVREVDARDLRHARQLAEEALAEDREHRRWVQVWDCASIAFVVEGAHDGR